MSSVEPSPQSGVSAASSSFRRLSLSRRAFTLGLCYVMGTFNDNFFKQGALLLALAAGNAAFPAWGTFLFSLPFALFSLWTGWLADRYPKKNLVIGAKLLELAAMLAGAWGLVTLNWIGLAAMLFCMGLSSTLFSPALNGSIPELFPARVVPRVNALFKLCTTASILLGISLAGAALDVGGGRIAELGFARPTRGMLLLACGVVLVALAGVLCSVFVPRRPAAGSSAPFPRLAVLDVPVQLKELRRDMPLFLAVWGEVFFYFLSSLLLLEINALGELELGFSHSATSLMPGALLLGICIGSLAAARGTPESWKRRLVPACLGIGGLLCLTSAVSLLPGAVRYVFLLALYTCAGACGGVYLIPLTSFIQVRPAPDCKGRVLGLDNCLVFSGIMLAGPAYYALSFLRPSEAHAVLGLSALAAAWAFARAIARLPDNGPDNGPGNEQGNFTARRSGALFGALALFVRGCLSLRYRIEVRGLKELDAGDDGRPVLFLASHPSLTDPVILSALLWRYRPRPLADEGQAGRPFIRQVVSLVRPVYIPDVGNAARGDRRAAARAVREGLRRAAEALRAGDCVLLYPSGKLTSDGLEHLGSNGGAWHLLEEAPECRVALIRTSGLWGSSFSRWGSRWGSRGGRSGDSGQRQSDGTLETPDFFHAFFAALRDLLLNLVVFMPRRPVRICVVEALRAGSTEAEKEKHKAPVLPVQDRLALNRALEAFFNTRGAAPGEKTDAHLAELSFSADEPVRPEEPPRYFWFLLHKRSTDRRPRS